MSLTRQQWTLLGIFALFIGPVVLVMMMRSSWWQYQPAGLKNQGYLVQPPVKLELQGADAFEHKWVVLYILESPCEKKCIENVTALRQVHRASGRRAENLSIVLLSDIEPRDQLRQQLMGIYPDFHLLADTSGNALATLETIHQTMQSGQSGLSELRTFVLDPMLNVILAYGSGTNPNDLHADLKRLLKLSDQENR
jgi:peroxiredoxin